MLTKDLQLKKCLVILGCRKHRLIRLWDLSPSNLSNLRILVDMLIESHTLILLLTMIWNKTTPFKSVKTPALSKLHTMPTLEPVNRTRTTSTILTPTLRRKCSTIQTPTKTVTPSNWTVQAPVLRVQLAMPTSTVAQVLRTSSSWVPSTSTTTTSTSSTTSCKSTVTTLSNKLVPLVEQAIPLKVLWMGQISKTRTGLDKKSLFPLMSQSSPLLSISWATLLRRWRSMSKKKTHLSVSFTINCLKSNVCVILFKGVATTVFQLSPTSSLPSSLPLLLLSTNPTSPLICSTALSPIPSVCI